MLLTLPGATLEIARTMSLKQYAHTGALLGNWLASTFDYYEPPTIAEMIAEHPSLKTERAMRRMIRRAVANGYIETRGSAEGTVYIPGPKLR